MTQYDGEDNRPGSPHFDTPKTLLNDGLGRLIEVREVETLSQADSGTFITRYRYTLPDLLAEIEDANGNIKYMRYDALGRRIFMNDCNRGHVTDTYDSVGNEIETVDAKGQRIVYTYDGVNRLLTEDYLDEGTPLSLNLSPDVIYHYDRPNPDYPWLRNLRGQLAWVEDLTGAEFHGFDMRGNMETVVKRIAQIWGGYEDYATTTYSDSLGRAYQVIYPDGGVVRQSHDSRGLLARIPHFVEPMSYEASGQKDVCTFGNGVVTTYDYDPRLRLTRLSTESKVEVLQDLNYSYDQADNIVRIDDGRELPAGDQRNQTASYLYDNCFRLIQAKGEGYRPEGLGTINYDYDRLGNMASKTSPDIDDPDVNLGTMITGGSLGTAGRFGKSAGDAPGPHALTLIVNGPRVRQYEYDDNGNMTVHDGADYVWDFKDRLGRVEKKGRDISYLYDYTDRRVIKRVDGAQTTYISKLSEIRDAQMINYVFAGGTRVAQVKGTMPEPETITQRISLLPGWNLISFQVVPASSDPAELLAGIDGKYTAVFGHDGNHYTRYVPGADDNTLHELRPNRGYWIHMLEPAELLVEGPLDHSPVVLPAGQWTLTGLPGLRSRALAALLREHAAIQAVWSYPGDAAGWLSWYADAWSLVDSSLPEATQLGAGYWVLAQSGYALAPLSWNVADISFYHLDRLGSTNVVTAGGGILSSETIYYPFGAQRYERPRNGTKYVDPNYRFGDKEQDSESNLLYFEARYSEPAIGRFTSADALLFDPASHISDPQRTHAHSYARNSPCVLMDPTGKDVVAIGVSVEGALGIGVRGGIGIAITFGEEGFDVGIYGTGGGQAALGGEAAAGLQFSWNPGRRSDFTGPTVNVGGTVAVLGGVGVEGQIPLRAGAGPGNTTYSVSIGVGVGAEVHGGAGYTGMTSARDIGRTIRSSAALLRSAGAGQEPSRKSVMNCFRESPPTS